MMSDVAITRMLLVDRDLAVGEFVCPPEDWRWRDENDIGEGFHVVYPWTPVHIARRAMPGTVATPNHAVLYPPRLRFHRRHLCGEGDHCLFVVLSPALRDELVPDPERLRDPVLPPALWLGQRLLAEYLRRPDHDPVIASRIAREVVRRTLSPSLDPAGGTAGGGAVERTQELMAAATEQLLPRERLARETHYSPFHLLRAFHARTGYTVHQYHLQLRLRRSVDLVLAGTPLADVALGLGFQGHSHFTARFRRAFGWTPSAVREVVCDGDAVPALVGELVAAA
jgi:AraC family transcriptional regulator